ncbi:MAG: class C sortase [Defluviitaleaceae bacterium]|nr:class C sortase [Defluviitaleaceae bacterium]
MKRDIKIFLVLMLLAIGSIAYPRIQQWRFNIRAQSSIAEFEARMEYYRGLHQMRMAELSSEHDIQLEYEDCVWLTNVRMGLSLMNHRLYIENQEHLVDPFKYAHPSFNIEPFGLNTYIVGVLKIPVMDLSLPIYLGTSPENLNSGAAHLTHSSFPVGGTNTNAVIAGHRNMTHGRVFRDIDQLKIGDEIIIANFLQTIEYVVVETKIVEYYETDALAIQSGRDLITLVTTHNHWRGNRRYVVVAERIAGS